VTYERSNALPSNFSDPTVACVTSGGTVPELTKRTIAQTRAAAQQERRTIELAVMFAKRSSE